MAMKIHFLPSHQEGRNARIIRGLRPLLVGAWFLVLLSVAIGAVLYVRGPVEPASPALVASDSGRVICQAAQIAPDLILCGADGPAEAIRTNGSQRVSIQRVGAATIGEGSGISLYRSAAPLLSETQTPTVVARGQRLVSINGEMVWQGAVPDRDEKTISVDPPFALPAGTFVYLHEHRSAVVGISALEKGRAAIVPIATILGKFRETRSQYVT